MKLIEQFPGSFQIAFARLQDDLEAARVARIERESMAGQHDTPVSQPLGEWQRANTSTHPSSDKVVQSASAPTSDVVPSAPKSTYPVAGTSGRPKAKRLVRPATSGEGGANPAP